MGIYLAHDYRKDKGAFTKAKVLHTLVLTYLVWYYSTAFAYLGSLFRRADVLIGQYRVPVGYLSAEANLTVWALQLVISCLIIHFAWGMTNRKDKARRRLLAILPFQALVETFGFYRGFVSGGDAGLHHGLILLLGLLFAGLLNGLLLSIYRSRLMLDFFAGTAKVEQEAPFPITLAS
jgi:hypothetical protein